MPVTVPIVSKKSLSMMVKIARIAASTPASMVKIPARSWRPRPSVLKLGVHTNSSGMACTPVMMARMVVAAMLMISAPLTFRVQSAKVRSRPARKTKSAGSVGNWNASGGGGGANSGVTPTIIPPSQKPMNRMNRPMPTPMARFRPSGTAFMIASRRPTMTSNEMMRPSMTITPMAWAAVMPRPSTRPNATAAFRPRPAARAKG